MKKIIYNIKLDKPPKQEKQVSFKKKKLTTKKPKQKEITSQS